MKEGRDFRKEAIAAVKAELLALPAQTRTAILSRTGLGIPDFQAAQKALGLECTLSNVAATRGCPLWSLPTPKSIVPRINVMTVAPYFEPVTCAPRAGSLSYKSIQSRGMPT